MTTPYVYHTATKMPLEALTLFGINAKPNSTNPIGYFGTGLKLAVAVIMRHGGTVKLFIEDVEYVIYATDQIFRGKEFESLRIKRRKLPATRFTSIALPYTTELGKNWHLWQAHRELESNTRDEGGTSGRGLVSYGGTRIEIHCDEFKPDEWDENSVFLNNPGKLVWETPRMKVYDSPSLHLYYRGVRVYDMRYPSRFTYDFKQGQVTLNENRSAENAYALFYYISQMFMSDRLPDSMIYKALNHKSKDGSYYFEGHDLTYPADSFDVSERFRDIARKLSMKGWAATAALSYHSASTFEEPEELEGYTVKLDQKDFEQLVAQVQDMCAADWPNDEQYHRVLEALENAEEN